jgi:predicted amidophosphoribosyltransferase
VADEVTKFILGDTAISAIEQAPPRRRRFFGRRKTQRPPLTHCENCGAPLSGPYCAQCGQAAIDYRRSFGHVFVDVLNEFLN